MIGCLIAGGALSVAWVSRYAVAVHRLARGVGDTVFSSADGKPWFRLDEQRHDISLDQISPHLQHAVVAVEDRRFYYHPGVDPIGIARALVHDIRSGGRFEGGSTLTQQLARTLFLSNVRTYGRKLKEAAIAVMIEAQLTKTQILELYLNRVYLSAGVYGVQTISEHLFRKSADTVTLPEAALIAGLIRAPSALSPWSNYDGALDRSHLVLARMRELGFITAEEEQAARRVRPRIQPYRQPADARAGWAKEFLRQQFRNEFGGDHPPDWQVQTTFRPSIQDAAERAVSAGLERLRRPGLEAALVAIDPATGDILAMVGGANYQRSTFNRATRSRRQPGSAFKPFVYAAALERGYSPVSVLTNLRHVSAPENPEWNPRSSEGDPDQLTLRAALFESNNAAAADLQQQVGSRNVLSLASDAGLSSLPDVPSLALGTSEVTVLEMCSAYTTFANLGVRTVPNAILRVEDRSGKIVWQPTVRSVAVMDTAHAWLMTDALRDVVRHGTAVGSVGSRINFPAGGKKTFQIQNTDRLLTGAWGVETYDGLIGVKNGYTSNAGNTFTGAATRGGRTLLVTVMHPKSGGSGVYEETAQLLDWGFKNAAQAEAIALAPQVFERIEEWRFLGYLRQIRRDGYQLPLPGLLKRSTSRKKKMKTMAKAMIRPGRRSPFPNRATMISVTSSAEGSSTGSCRHTASPSR